MAPNLHPTALRAVSSSDPLFADFVARDFPPSLDAPLSSVDQPQFLRPVLPEPDRPSQDWRFTPFRRERAYWKDVVAAVEPDPSRLERFFSCGDRAVVEWSPSLRKHRVRAFSCGSRFCPHCRIRRAEVMAARVAATLTDFHPHIYKLVTLTIRASDKPLVEQLEHLRASFRRLRQQEFWAKRVRYGRAILELTLNPRTGLWHPHYHVVCRAAFLPQRVLSIAWARATSGSFIVDVRTIRQAAQLASYLQKYLGQMSMLGDTPISTEKGKELYLALRDRHMIIPFGGPPPMPTEAEALPHEDDPGDWQFIGMLEWEIIKARRGDKKAIALLRMLDRGPPGGL